MFLYYILNLYMLSLKTYVSLFHECIILCLHNGNNYLEGIQYGLKNSHFAFNVTDFCIHFAVFCLNPGIKCSQILSQRPEGFVCQFLLILSWLYYVYCLLMYPSKLFWNGVSVGIC